MAKRKKPYYITCRDSKCLYLKKVKGIKNEEKQIAVHVEEIYSRYEIVDGLYVTVYEFRCTDLFTGFLIAKEYTKEECLQKIKENWNKLQEYRNDAFNHNYVQAKDNFSYLLENPEFNRIDLKTKERYQIKSEVETDAN